MHGISCVFCGARHDLEEKSEAKGAECIIGGVHYSFADQLMLIFLTSWASCIICFCALITDTSIAARKVSAS